MEVDFTQIIISGYLYVRNKPDLDKHLIAHFTREAKFAKGQDLEYYDFFSNLKRVIEEGKADIENQYNSQLTKNDFVIESILSGKGVYKNEIVRVTDYEELNGYLTNLYKDRNSIENEGFKNNNSYKHRMIDMEGNSIYLIYTNLELIGDAIERSEEELLGSRGENGKLIHFTRTFTNKELKYLFKSLIEEKLLFKNTVFSHFCYVFGGVPIPVLEEPFEALIWEGKVSLLAYLVDMLFGDSDKTKLWEITSKCFICKGKMPNKDTMKNCVYKYGKGYCEKPKEAEIINSIILNKL
ncbi:MAG: hypothetical protein WCX48_06350 [Bacteroidales bacterium]